MKIFLKVVKWLCFILGFIGLIGIAEISWRGLKAEWKSYVGMVKDYNNPKPYYNYIRRTK